MKTCECKLSDHWKENKEPYIIFCSKHASADHMKALIERIANHVKFSDNESSSPCLNSCISCEAQSILKELE